MNHKTALASATRMANELKKVVYIFKTQRGFFTFDTLRGGRDIFETVYPNTELGQNPAETTKGKDNQNVASNMQVQPD